MQPTTLAELARKVLASKVWTEDERVHSVSLDAMVSFIDDTKALAEAIVAFPLVELTHAARLVLVHSDPLPPDGIDHALALTRALESIEHTTPANYRDKVAVLLGQEVLVRFDSPSSSRKHAAFATGTLAIVDDDGIIVRGHPGAGRKPKIPWAKIQYVGLSNPDWHSS